MQPQKSASLTDLMTPEERSKAERKAELRDATKAELITAEWMMLSELGVNFGWGAIEAVLNDTITLQQAKMLNQGAGKLHSADVYEQAIACAAGNSNRKGFDKLMKPFIRNMKVNT